MNIRTEEDSTGPLFYVIFMYELIIISMIYFSGMSPLFHFKESEWGGRTMAFIT